jgi:GntR family transcriptional regulator, galactonate operon transcriptional repressor
VTKRFTIAPLQGRSRLGAAGGSRSDLGDEEALTFDRHIHGYLAATLGREIVAGVHPPGSLLPNAPAICQRFGVSRTVLREAYNLLAAKALIVARPKVGTRVRPKAEWRILDPDVLAWHLQAGPGETFISDLFELRQMVEPAAAALAAEGRVPGTIKRIAEAFDRMERFRDGQAGLIEADLDFHMAILGATSNPFLTAFGSLIHASLQFAFRISWGGAARIQDARLHQHGLILAAIREGAPNRARRRMTELLRDSLDDARRSPPRTAR